MAGKHGQIRERWERDRLQALLRQVRQEAGLRQQDLAVRLGEPQSWVSKVENGERKIDVLELRRVCHAVGLPLAVFIERLEGELKAATEATVGGGVPGGG